MAEFKTDFQARQHKTVLIWIIQNKGGVLRPYEHFNNNSNHNVKKTNLIFLSLKFGESEETCPNCSYFRAYCAFQDLNVGGKPEHQLTSTQQTADSKLKT